MAAFNFRGMQGRFDFGLADWHFIVELGEDYGWKPEGTIFRERPKTPDQIRIREWDAKSSYPPGYLEELFHVLAETANGFDEADDSEARVRMAAEEKFLEDYFSNDGQWVTEEDAKSLAGALENALDDIPNHNASSGKDRQNALPRRIAKWNRAMFFFGPSPSIQESIAAKEWFSGEKKSQLKDFIAFCRQGGFQIF